MKKTQLPFLFFAVLAITACKKNDKTNLLNAGAINVTNAVVDAPTITMVTSPSYISSSNLIDPNSFALMPIPSGQTQVKISKLARAATTTSAAVPEVLYYNQTLSVDQNSNYSLFLTGASASAVDNVLIKEKFQLTYADSVCGVRFINLIQGNVPVAVNLKNNATGSEALNLAYKAYTDFKQYPAKKVNPNYVFEFRKLDGTLITSYNLTTPYFHNVTLALSGTMGGSVGVILDNNY